MRTQTNLEILNTKRGALFQNRFGFAEFNSDTYAPISFKAIASVVALAEDSEIKKMAEMVMNLQLFDHIIGSQGRR